VTSSYTISWDFPLSIPPEAETVTLSGEKFGVNCVSPAYTVPEKAAIIVSKSVFLVIFMSLIKI
jgi:hypothetical protein